MTRLASRKYLKKFAILNPRLSIGGTILFAITAIEGVLAYSA